ncbi:DNA-binding transcriptional regulator OxyR, partial [Escherichia coli]|nr:DNA-binding transcriptional regulator OxyR [Escherichia coli]
KRTIVLVYRPGSPLRGRYEQLAETIYNSMDNYYKNRV